MPTFASFSSCLVRGLAVTRRFSPGIGLALILAVSTSITANAEAQEKTQPACPSGHVGENCLTAFEVDLDGDLKPDRVGLIFEPVRRIYHVVVYTQSGREFWPFRASLSSEHDKVTLASRSGGGDLRCRIWVAGKECGYPVASHDVPAHVLYLSDSKHGDFVLYIPQAYGRGYNATGVFVVMPALDDISAGNGPKPEK